MVINTILLPKNKRVGTFTRQINDSHFDDGVIEYEYKPITYKVCQHDRCDRPIYLHSFCKLHADEFWYKIGMPPVRFNTRRGDFL